MMTKQQGCTRLVSAHPTRTSVVLQTSVLDAGAKTQREQPGPQHNVLFYIRVWMTSSIRVSSGSRSDSLKLGIPRFVVCVLHPRVIQSMYSEVKQGWLSCTHWYEVTVELFQGRFKCKIQSLEQKTLRGALHMGCMLRSARAGLIRESRVGASGI